MQPFFDEHQHALQICRREDNLCGDVTLGSRVKRATKAEKKQVYSKQVHPGSGKVQRLHEASLSFFCYFAE